MKKKIKYIIWMIIFIIIFYSVFHLFIKEHQTTYKVNKYEIEEHFSTKNTHIYEFIVTKKQENYNFRIQENMRKQKKVIKEIKTFKKNNIICIVPIYKKDISLNIYCDIDNQQVSLSYLLIHNKEEFQEIQEKTKKYNINYPKSNKSYEEIKNQKIYFQNIPNNQKLIIWNYKGINIYDKDKISTQEILDYDLYDNVMAIIQGPYYVIFENTSVNGIKNIYYYDLEKNKLKNMELKETISKDSYINGTMNNLIYITDNKEKKEYSVDISKEKIERIDNGLNYIVWKDGKAETMTKSDFFLQEQLFLSQEDSKIQDEWNIYYLEENQLFRKSNLENSKSTLLLELENVIEWKKVGEELILLQEDTIYLYSETLGLRKILEYSELKYNYQNIYQWWIK